MRIFNLFKRSDIECPRCLGKGFVDWEDIARLNRRLKWVPAPCAYCNATGKVEKEMLSKVAVDCMYLTIDLPESVIEKIKEGDRETVEKGKQRELFVEFLIQYAEHHYFTQNMDAESIANLYLKNEAENAPFSATREELIKYIQGVIELKKSVLN
ncbi:hypothetical protein HNP37_000076 [Flavobacterium nitrogenifigens]|uniref:Uncharacterized protein n=2 Tax=Flavobacterium TaxID=237 RepID=A0A7W7ITP5_9FLAO|nr:MULTISPECIES: hypothetical protein [Flavobacterium]MBB4800037.1 hypothetical protein [Flavobacterium nitrogenifigens]MBB6386213.1 hypothetical protein [Flavobacterium notoginsengisoli]